MRALALELMVGLIVALLIGVVLIIAIYSSGMIASFNENIILMITTLSAYFRIELVRMINVFIAVVATILMIILVIRSFTSISNLQSLLGLSEAIGGVSLKTSIIGGSVVSFNTLAAIASLIVFIMVTQDLLPMIPLYAPTINVNIGSTSKPVDNTTYVSMQIAQRISNTWNAFGSGTGDPLEGMNNPYLYYTIFVHMKKGEQITLSDVYSNLTKQYGDGYPIYVYCDNSRGIIGKDSVAGNLPVVNWVSKCDSTEVHSIQTYGGACTIKNGDEVNIYYLDSFRSVNVYANVYTVKQPKGCPYVCGVGDFSKDAIIVCVTSS